MRHVVVIGGGFAGLATAVALAERGLRVTVLERRAQLGGRAYSFRDRASGSVVDNGQHAMMGCYTETLAFLDRLAAGPRLVWFENLRVDMIDARRGPGAIACARLPGPLHMLSGVLRYRLLSGRERRRAIVAGLRLLGLRRRHDAWLAAATVAEVLARLGQSANACASFWYPVAIATLNETPERAAAAPFAEVLARAFFGRRRNSAFVLPAVGLSDLYTDGARRFVEQHGGTVECRATATAVELAGERVAGVQLRDGRRVAADGCVAAVPPRALAALAPPALHAALRAHELAALDTSPIVSAHLWYDRPVLMHPFVGLIGTKTHWLFNRSQLLGEAGNGSQCLSAVISGNRDVVEWETDRIAAVVDSEVRRVLPPAQLQQAVVVKERHATVAPTPAAARLRPPTATPIRNFVLAGDWIATGLPATIESAVLSGHRAAAALATHLGG